jgi:hypothetical protein
MICSILGAPPVIRLAGCFAEAGRGGVMRRLVYRFDAFYGPIMPGLEDFCRR